MPLDFSSQAVPLEPTAQQKEPDQGLDFSAQATPLKASERSTRLAKPTSLIPDKRGAAPAGLSAVIPEKSTASAPKGAQSVTIPPFPETLRRGFSAQAIGRKRASAPRSYDAAIEQLAKAGAKRAVFGKQAELRAQPQSHFPVMRAARGAMDWVNRVSGIDAEHKANQWIADQAHLHGLTTGELKTHLGGIRGQELADQFASAFANQLSFGILKPSAAKPDSAAGELAKGAGSLAGFIAGPAKATSALGKVAGEWRYIKPLARYFNVAKTDGRILALAKDMARQGIHLGVAQGAAASGEALSKPDVKSALKTYGHALLSGAATGGVFGASGRLIKGRGALNVLARAAATSTALDALNGTNPLDRRPLHQKLFDYGLNLVFSLGGEAPARRQRREIPSSADQSTDHATLADLFGEAPDETPPDDPGGPPALSAPEPPVMRVTPEGEALTPEHQRAGIRAAQQHPGFAKPGAPEPPRTPLGLPAPEPPPPRVMQVTSAGEALTPEQAQGGTLAALRHPGYARAPETQRVALTAETFERYVKPNLTPGYANTVEQYQAKHPEISQIPLARDRPEQPWRLARRADIAAARAAPSEAEPAASAPPTPPAAKPTSQMSLAELRRERVTDQQTGIPNRVAFNEATPSAVVGIADLDGLKWVNDTFGHHSGDTLLKAAAEALHQHTGGAAYRLHGDEFAIRADSEDNAHAAFERANAALNQAELTFVRPDGTRETHSNFGFSYGTGDDLSEADARLQEHKAARTEAGLRRERGQAPGRGLGASAAGHQGDLAPSERARDRAGGEVGAGTLRDDTFGGAAGVNLDRTYTRQSAGIQNGAGAKAPESPSPGEGGASRDSMHQDIEGPSASSIANGESTRASELGQNARQGSRPEALTSEPSGISGEGADRGAASHQPTEGSRQSIAGHEQLRKDEDQTGARTAPGQTRRVYTAQGAALEVVPRVLEVADLIASHDASGKVNPAYPRALQPRNRARAASAAQISHIANNLNPALLGESASPGEGAPIVGEDRVVESGNGRVAALEQAYRNGKGQAYKQYLIDHAEALGVDQNTIKTMAAPVLVRARVTPLNESQRAEFARQANQANIAALSGAEQAEADAERLSDADIALYEPGENGEVLSAANRPFVRRFAQLIGANESGALLTPDGRATKQMADRITAAIFAKAYHSPKLTQLMAEEAHPELRNILYALNRAAPAFVRARAIDPALGGLEIVPAINDAVDLIRTARNTKRALDDMLAQGGLYERRDPAREDLARFIDHNIRSSKRLGEGLAAIARLIETETRANTSGSLFDAPPITLKQVIDAARRQLGQDNGETEDQAPEPTGASEPRRAGRGDGRAVGGGARGGEQIKGERARTQTSAEARDEVNEGREPPLPKDRGALGGTRQTEAHEQPLPPGRVSHRDVRETQGDLLGGASPTQQQAHREGLKRDRARHSGQHSPETGDSSDLFSAARSQLELFTPKGASDAPTRKAAQFFGPRVKFLTTSTYPTGIDTVKGSEDLAHVVAPLRRAPQEQLLVIVTDKAGKVLTIVRHTIGRRDAADADVGLIAGAAHSVEGAANVWFAHNHPSGDPTQSDADRRLTSRLHEVFDGTGIADRGMVVVAPDGRASYFRAGEVSSTRIEIHAARRQRRLPIAERAFRRVHGAQVPTIHSPESAKAVIDDVSRGETGVVFLDTRHRPVAFLPMSDAEMRRLKTNRIGTGASRLAQIANESNASALMARVASDPSVDRAARQAGSNVMRFAQALQLRGLDVFGPNSLGKLESGEARGVIDRDGPYYAVREGGFGQTPGLFEKSAIPVIRVLRSLKNLAALKANAEKTLRVIQHGAGLKNNETGWSFGVSKLDRKKLLDDPHKQDRPIELAAIGKLARLTHGAVLAETHADYKDNPDVAAVHRFYAPLKVNGRLYRVKLTVKDYTGAIPDKRNLHELTAVEIEDPAVISPAPSDHRARAPVQPAGPPTLSIAQLLKGARRDSDGAPFTPEALAEHRRSVPVTTLPDGLFDVAPAALWRTANTYYTDHIQGTREANARLDGEIVFSGEGRKKALFSGRRDRVRMSAVKALPQLAREAIPYHLTADTQGRPDIAQFVHAVAPLEIDGELYAVRLTLKALYGEANKPRFYDFRGFDIEEPGAMDRGDVSRDSAQHRGSPGSTISLDTLLKAVKDKPVFARRQAPHLAGLSISGAKNFIAKHIGAQSVANITAPETGFVHIVQHQSELPAHLQPKARGALVGGVSDPGTGHVWLVGDNLEPGASDFDPWGLILHEVGTHAGLFGADGLLTDAQYRDVMRQVRAGAATAGSRLAIARARVPETTRPEHIDEETLAYFVGDAKNHKSSLARRIFAAIRAWLYRRGIVKRLSNADLVALIKAAVRKRTRRAGRPAAGAHADEPLYATVFHGSPYRGIEKEGFKLQKIGTGEGHQAYGWGHYFASQRAIAEFYRDNLSEKRRIDDPEFGDAIDKLSDALQGEDDLGFDSTREAIHAIQAHPDWRERWQTSDPDALQRLLDALTHRRKELAGNVYRAETPEDSDLLDWDKPLLQQPRRVRDALAALDLPDPTHMDGQDIYSYVTKLMAERSGEVTSASHPREYQRFYRRASEYLSSLGIPGLRYLNGSSRTHGQGSANYVIWDESAISDVTPLYAMREVKSGLAAARRVLAQKTDEPAALESREYGPVTLVYGIPGDSKRRFKGGYGLSHIVAKHGREVLDKVIETVALGKSYKRQTALRGERVLLTHDGHTALLSLYKHGDRESWLLTGWDEENPGGMGAEYDAPTPTPAEPTRSRPDEVAGSSQMSITRRADGSVKVAGEAQAIRAALKEAGIEAQGMPAREGLIFGKRHARAIEAALGDKTRAHGAPLYAMRMERRAEEPRPPGTTQTSLPLYEAGDHPGRIGVPEETIMQRLQRALQDRFNRMGVVQGAIKTAGGTITDDIDIYAKEMLLSSKSEYALDRLDQEHVGPLVNAIAKSSVSLAELDDYLTARHTPGRNRAIQARNPDFTEGGSGYTDAEAEQILAAFTPEQTEDLEALAARVDTINRQRRQILVRSGLESPERVAGWERMFGDPYYVPLKGAPGAEEASRMHTGQGLDTRGSTVKHMKGRRSLSESPTVHSIMQLEEAIVRAGKNAVGQALGRLVDTYPDPRVWEKKARQAFQEQRYNPDTNQVEWGYDPLGPDQDNVFHYRERGRDVYVQIHDPILAKQLKNLGDEQTGKVLQHLGAVNRFLSVMSTMANPPFVLTNAIRDAITAAIKLQAEQDVGGALQGQRGLARKVLADVPHAIRGAYGSLRAKEANEWSSLMDRYQAAGGHIGFFGLRDINARIAMINRDIRMAGDGMLAQGRRGFKATRKLIEDVNKAVENGVRLATFKHALDAGLSEQAAAVLAKNLTVNFTKRGEFGTFFNSLYLFANAGMQGTAMVTATLKSKSVRRIMLGLMVAAFFTDQLNRRLGGKDDQTGEDRIDTVNDWEKDTNIIIMLPDGHYGKLVLPYGFNMPWAVGTRLSQLSHGSITPGQAGLKITDAFLNAFNPLGNDAADSVLQWGFKNFSPTIAKPFVDMAFNSDFTGRPLHPEPNPFAEFAPPNSENAFKNTNQVAKWIAKGLSHGTGGDKFEGGAIDINPANLQHLAEFAAGGLGATLTRTGNLAARVLANDTTPIEIRDVPFLRRVLGAKNPYYASIRYRQIRPAMARLWARFKASDAAGREAILAKHRDVLAAYRSTEAALRRLQRAIHGLEKRHGKSDQIRIKRLKDIEKQIENRAIRAWVGQARKAG